MIKEHIEGKDIEPLLASGGAAFFLAIFFVDSPLGRWLPLITIDPGLELNLLTLP